MSRLFTKILLYSILLVGCPLAWWVIPGQATEERVPEFSAADLEFFEKEVRPILANRCYECHSGQNKKPKGGLRVDSRAALLAGGDTGPAIELGDPRKSLLIDAINYGETYQMPPKSRLPNAEVATLTKWVERGAPWPKEVAEATSKSATFDLAARKAAHWCWRPVQSYPPPTVRNTAWPRQELDRFVLAKLEERGLSPAPPTDRRTLLRRVYFDLLGLPPTLEQADAFLRDESPQAFEKLVDELLESPHFGERWARHWMDLVRYAETCGHEFDYPIHNAWRYRDYLIRAFNADLPYDQFVIEHVAGDLLPNPRLHPKEDFNESIIGTGFWWLHEAIHAPVDVQSDAAGRIDNQIDVFSKTFLGITVACARCHDHKFDAISTKDYYALAGFLRSTRRQEALLDPGGEIHALAERVLQVRTECQQSLRQWANEERFPTSDRFRRHLLAVREVIWGQPQLGEPAAAAGHRRAIEPVARQFELSDESLKLWLEALTGAQVQEADHPLQIWSKLALSKSAVPDSAAFTVWREQWHESEATRAATNADYEVFDDFENGSFGGWMVTGEAFGKSPTITGRWDGLATGRQLVESGAAHSGQLSPRFHGVLRSPTFTINTRNIYYRMAGQDCEMRLVIDGYTMIEFHQLLFGGCKFPINTAGKWVWHRQSGDLGMYQGHRAYIELVDHGDGWAALDRVCFSNRDTPPTDTPSATLSVIAADKTINSLDALAKRLGEQWDATVRRWRANAANESDAKLVNWALTHKWIGEDAPLALDRVLNNAPRSSVWPSGQQETAERRIGELLRNLPAPMRVTAAIDGSGENERVFIRGNPRTLGEEAPRQLLVALVGPQPLIQEGSGRLTLARQVADPANSLTSRVLVNRVWHHLFGAGIVPAIDNFGVLGEPPTHPELLDHLAQQFVTEGWSIKRLIRSLVLSSTYQMSSAPNPAADEADPTNRLWHRMNIRRLEGEAIRDAILVVSGRLDVNQYGPGVPVHITPFMQGRGKPSASGPLDGGGRRSLYTEVRRNFLSPMMLAFDTPIPFNTVGRRNKSNVPGQALILMNDPFVVDQAQLWAKQLLSEKNLGWEERVNRAFLAAISRPPTTDELSEVRGFFASQARERDVSGEQAVSDLQCWSDFCHVLFNVKEFAFLQ